ncbi:tripartite motif-containing protein 16-like protein isoform X1 [Sinocyclocheilus rhinocerous]|uniref:tripartite motif-containing protein 16-like protein isoform X1 n=1 Tax=Sinocyclocheilus rhinocerous TaxID=307959 RepID=UPI0007B8DDAE|nr:PREDICTED: tripartite motif-containing protein 16-like protein isoform X1 [Sinocyclocheilus rhinocerous]
MWRNMTEASISLGKDQFSCPICLDLLKDPVTIPCGHSYCMNCITDCWNKDDQKRVYRCPQCRQTFTPRPALNKNVMLDEMVEKLKKTRSALSYAGPGDEECDVCIGRKRKAVKSCLMCLESYCQTHFECHEESHTRKRHKVTDATGRIQEMICSKHDRLLEVFCRSDQKCICLICVMDEHKTHDTVSAEAERTEKQKQVGETVIIIQKKIQERQTELQKLSEFVQTHKSSAQAAVKDSERIFTELIHCIEKSQSVVIQMIRDREKAEVSQAEGLLKQLEQEIYDLRRRDAELKQLLHTENHIHFLQNFQLPSAPPASSDSTTVGSLLSYDDVRSSVSIIKTKFENFCSEEIEKISGGVNIKILTPITEPKTREHFLHYYHQFTLDSESVHKHLCLSEENTVAACTATLQPYPDHPDRFDVWPQVLCKESLCARCYWEVEWSGTRGVGISVSYKSISRKGRGNECKFGCNDQSWRLFCSPSGFLFSHNNKKSELPVFSSSSRIGVYVDHSAGILSFYSVSDTMTLIHRIQTTFTRPLHPGFGITQDSSVKLCPSAV